MTQDKINNFLTLIFLILAVAAGVSYFAIDDRTVFWYCGGAAVCIRFTQYVMKFLM